MITVPRKQPKLIVTRQYKNHQVATFKNYSIKILRQITVVFEIAEGLVTTEVSNSFNNFFSEIGPNLSDKLPNPDYPPESHGNSINADYHFRTITDSEVLN